MDSVALPPKSGVRYRGGQSPIAAARMRYLGDRLRAEHNAARMASAGVATAKSQAIFKSRTPWPGRPARAQIGPRPRRPTTQGTFPSHLLWDMEGTDLVAFNVAKLEAVAPYWPILEIGTGNSANAKVAKSAGRNATGGTSEVLKASISVKSQVGRPIPVGLTWSGATGTDQIVPAGSRLSGSGRASGKGQIIIQREIKPKGYIRIGGNRGFAVYRRHIEEAWRRIYGGHPIRNPGFG